MTNSDRYYQLKVRYREFYDEVVAVLFRHDPVKLNFETNTDEYELEVSTILPRLHKCLSADDVVKVIHEEFVRWFGEATAGPREDYTEVAREVWEHWQRFNASK